MKKIIILLFLLPIVFAKAQNLKDNGVKIPFFGLSYSPQIPGGDFAKRFGFTNNVGFNFGIKTAKNWQIEFEGCFLFGNQIKEDSILDFIRTTEGYIIDQYGDAVAVYMYQRGFTESIMVGKIFPVGKSNANSGIITKLGVGFMHHKIRVENHEYRVPALTKPNLVYVDRLTMGVAVKQYIGYQNFSNNKRINFHFGIELTEGFTQGMRDYQMGYGSYREKRFEFLIGIRAGWLLPVYRKVPEEFYYD